MLNKNVGVFDAPGPDLVYEDYGKGKDTIRRTSRFCHDLGTGRTDIISL